MNTETASGTYIDMTQYIKSIVTIKKRQVDITKDEWICWEWDDVTQHNDTERYYIRGVERSINDAVTAAANWDIYREAYQETLRNE